MEMPRREDVPNEQESLGASLLPATPSPSLTIIRTPKKQVNIHLFINACTKEISNSRRVPFPEEGGVKPLT
jgi:hypothetical protein